ncbi:MAG: GNAT family N-acetyltransferase [Pseudomonadota bacterium]
MMTPGFHPVPPGMVATIVTHLEMTDPPVARPVCDTSGRKVGAISQPTARWYRNLFQSIGTPWLWWSRLALTDAALEAIITDPDVALFTLQEDGADIGLLELDFRVAGECELAYFGLVPGATGAGGGRQLMSHAVSNAFARPITRLWLHTCTLDDPRALTFYRRAGFTPVRQEVEIAPDPRLAGYLPLNAGPHVPVFE